MPSKKAMEIEEKYWNAPERTVGFLATLIDEGVKPLVNEAREAADVCIPGYSMAIGLDEILKDWEAKA